MADLGNVGLWALVWMAGCCLVVVAGRYWPWLGDRLREPSTHANVAVMLIGGGLFWATLSLESIPGAQALIFVGFLIGVVGFVTEERGRR